MPPAVRADQVGSLSRPPGLLQARRRHEQSQLDRDSLTRAEDVAVLEALEMQCQVGLDVFPAASTGARSFAACLPTPSAE